MDRRTFLAIERVIRTDMTSEERARIGRVVREVAAGEALGALLGEKVVDLTETRRCPRCGADGIVKFGRDGNGQQRFRCRPGVGCGRTFNALTGSPMARMRKPAIWLSYAEALCERRSLDWIHEKLGIARLTAWRWRHRFGAALASRTSSSRSSSRLICAFTYCGKGRPSPVHSSSSRFLRLRKSGA